MRLRGRLHFGPALRRLRLPLRPTLVSLAFHGAFVAAVLWGNSVWGDSPTKTVYVNLVPAIAAVGRPQGAQLPPRPKDVPAPVTKPIPTDLPQREPSRELPSRDRQSDSLALPEPGLPPRAPGLPRPDDKELPTVASAARPKPPAPSPAPSAPARREAGAPPPPPLGQPGGSAQGVGALTLNVSDFPHAWYIAAIHRKIKERWDGYALAGQQPAVIFEIGREGDLRRIAVDKSSGNPYYDQAAVRAVTEAHPFPPLPPDFKKPVLTVGLQFAHDPSATR